VLRRRELSHGVAGRQRLGTRRTCAPMDSIKWFRRPSPRLCVALICVCALAGLYLFQRNVWRRAVTQNRSVAEQFVARYEPLRCWLPLEEPVGFMVDDPLYGYLVMPPSGRMFAAQYALAPRRVAAPEEQRLLILDSPRPGSVTEMPASEGWIVLADLHNGVRLYEKKAKE
jgi:hypothetical protein